MEDGLIRDHEAIRAIALHANRTGDTSRLSRIDPSFMFAGLYPHTIRTINKDELRCPKCGHDYTYEIGYENRQCHECLFVYKDGDKL
jgi:hypothetical protein